MIEHVVQQGECAASIGEQYGVPAKKLWRAPENEELAGKRKSPDVLMPGDRVYVHEHDRREEECQTEVHHRFVKHDDRAWLRLRFLDEGEPRKGEKYTLKYEGHVIHGKTNDEGRLEERIPAYVKEAVLRLGGQEAGEDYLLKLGELDPETELTGVQARLANLGFGCEVNGRMDAATLRAVREFQIENGIMVGRGLDDGTREDLAKVYES